MRYNRLYKDNNYLTPTTHTQELSEYAVNLKYEDLPAEVVERAKMIMLQTIGVTLAAKDTAIAKKIRQMALEANGGESVGPTTVWGTGEKLAAANAALALGTLSDALDWEDCSWTGRHRRRGPGPGAVPPVRRRGRGALPLHRPPLRRHHSLCLAGRRGEAQERQGPDHRHCGRL